MAWIVDYEMDLSDMDPLEVGELLSGLTEHPLCQLHVLRHDFAPTWVSQPSGRGLSPPFCLTAAC